MAGTGSLVRTVPDQEVQAGVEELADQRGGGRVEQLEVVDQEDDPAALAPVLDRLRDLREQRDRVAAVEQDPSGEQMGDRAERHLPRPLARHCSDAPPTAGLGGGEHLFGEPGLAHPWCAVDHDAERRGVVEGREDAVELGITADEGPSGADRLAGHRRRTPRGHGVTVLPGAVRIARAFRCSVAWRASHRGIEHIVLNT